MTGFFSNPPTDGQSSGSSFFNGAVIPPEANSTDKLLDTLAGQVQTVTDDRVRSEAAATAATAAANNAKISESNTSGLAQQANDTLAQANTAMATANAAVTTSTAKAAEATTQAAASASSAAASEASRVASGVSATASEASKVASGTSADASAASASASATSAAQALASKNASATSEANSAASAASALASKNAASTSEGTSSASAAASASSSTTSTTKAGESSASAAASAASATAAATSATNSANSATASAASATAAANTLAQLNSELPLSTTGGNTTLSAPDAANGIYRVTGTLTSNATITVPATPHSFTVHNLTTGSYTLSVVAQGKAPTAAVPQNTAMSMFSDANGVFPSGAVLPATPSFTGVNVGTGGVTFNDGSVQQTANSTTQANSQWYAVGTTDAVGTFADGDTAIRTAGFTAPFVNVWRDGLKLTRGQHYTLNADNIHINFTEALSSLDELEVQTQGVYNPSSTYLPSMPVYQPSVGATFIAHTHVVGFAWLMMRGVFLEAGTDYTEDSTGFTLVGFSADGTEKFTVFNLNAISIANALAAASPVIASGPLQFPDGSQQTTAPQSNRNLFVDGAFDRWGNDSQATDPGGGYANLVMWQGYAGAGGSATLSRSDFRGFTVAEASGSNYCVYTQSVASTGTVVGGTAPYLLQKIEGVQKASGKSITVSFKLWTGSGSLTIPQIMCRQYFGTGGSPSALLVADKAVNWVVTTTAKKFSVRIDVPSIAGKTIGSAGNDAVYVGFWLPPGVTFNMGIAEAQCELCSPNSSSDINGNGGSPTAFEYRGLQAELARVQRFYETGQFPAVYISDTAAAGFMFPAGFRVTKRNNPGVSYSQVMHYTSGTPTTTPGGNITTATVTTDGLSMYISGVSNVQGLAQGVYTADSRL